MDGRTYEIVGWITSVEHDEVEHFDARILCLTLEHVRMQGRGKLEAQTHLEPELDPPWDEIRRSK